jgi:hypothetical protein
MEKTLTMLDDLCMAMGIIAKGCLSIGLITEEEFDMVYPKSTRHTYVRYLPADDGDSVPAKKKAGIKNSTKHECGVKAYLSAPLIDFIDPEVTKYQRWKADNAFPSSEPYPFWYPKNNKSTGEVIKDEAYELCVKAAPLFKELVELIKKDGAC